jgi:hypothetical protein
MPTGAGGVVKATYFLFVIGRSSLVIRGHAAVGCHYPLVELNRSAVVAVRLSFSSFCSRVSLQFRRCY